MDVATQKVLMSSKKSDYCTPECVLDKVRALSTDGKIGLDPCYSAEGVTDPTHAYTENINGLIQPWTDKGLVFVNPPYGRGLTRWVQKCSEEAAKGAEIVLLIPARTDTKYFHNYVWNTAQEICFVKGRIVFMGEEHGAPFPSALVYWGDADMTFWKTFKDMGHVVSP